MIEKAKCFITVSEEGKGAYGVRADNEAAVYFPHSMSDRIGFEELDEVEALLKPNDRATPPWIAIKAVLVNGPRSLGS